MSDSISREEEIEAIASRDETDGTVPVFTGRQVNEILSALPSADRPKGHWIKQRQKCEYRCDQCGKIVFADDENELNFCCCCGAYMGGEGDA